MVSLIVANVVLMVCMGWLRYKLRKLEDVMYIVLGSLVREGAIEGLTMSDIAQFDGESWLGDDDAD